LHPVKPGPRIPRAFFIMITRSLRFLLLGAATAAVSLQAAAPASLEFCAAGDMRSFTENAKGDGRRFFDGVCEAMKKVGPGSFLISPGDFDPPAANRAIIDRYLGRDFLWYVIVGNHEVESAAVMPWVHEWMATDIPHLVRRGLPGTKLTIYSWDFGDSHFVAIDSYPWAKAGVPGSKDKEKAGNKGQVDLTDATFAWIDDDLKSSHQRFLWVIGHQPIQSMPDMDSGRTRHEGDSVSYDAARAERFVDILKRNHVRAYICGHTHDTSVVKLKSGIWQCDSGHARGGGDVGSPSSFLKFRIVGEQPQVEIYRGDALGVNYSLRKTVTLD
jgi:hypothetical protein